MKYFARFDRGSYQSGFRSATSSPVTVNRYVADAFVRRVARDIYVDDNIAGSRSCRRREFMCSREARQRGTDTIVRPNDRSAVVWKEKSL